MSLRIMRIAAVVALSGALGCSRDVPRPAPAVGAVGATIEAIEQKPEAYLGQTVTVSGEIERIHGKRAFTLGGGDFVFEKELLVVTPVDFTNVADRPGGVGLNADDIVQVTGEVRRLEVAEIEHELDLDLTPELEIEFKSRPVVIARALHSSERKRATAIGGGPRLTIIEPIADVAILIDAPPLTAIGKRVALDDVKIQSLLGDRAVWIGPSHRKQVLVALPQARTDLKIGDELDIIGRVEAPPTSAAARAHFGLDGVGAVVVSTEPNIIRAESLEKDD